MLLELIEISFKNLLIFKLVELIKKLFKLGKLVKLLILFLLIFLLYKIGILGLVNLWINVFMFLIFLGVGVMLVLID